MPRVDEHTYEFHSKDENAANQRFNEHLDQGHGIPEAIALVKAEFPNITEELIGWWMS